MISRLSEVVNPKMKWYSGLLMERQPADKASFSYRLADRCIRVISSVTASGLENLPQRGPYLLAYSHHNAWDVPAVGVAVYAHSERPVYFLAKEELLSKFAVGALLKSMHALPIKRDGDKRHAINQLDTGVDVIRNGHILGIAAEGGRINGNKVAEPAAAVGRVASRANAHIVPTGIAGRNWRLGKHGLWFVPRALHVHFGSPIIPDGSIHEYKKRVNLQLQPAVQQALSTAYEEYGRRYGEHAKTNLDSGVTKLF